MRKDYCGPYWMPAKLRKLVSNKFNASCKIHDLDYDSMKYSRKEADYRFLLNMKKQAKNNILFKIVAYAFYLMVRIGGSISWKKEF